MKYVILILCLISCNCSHKNECTRTENADTQVYYYYNKIDFTGTTCYEIYTTELREVRMTLRYFYIENTGKQYTVVFFEINSNSRQLIMIQDLYDAKRDYKAYKQIDSDTIMVDGATTKMFVSPKYLAEYYVRMKINAPLGLKQDKWNVKYGNSTEECNDMSNTYKMTHLLETVK